MRSEKQTIPVLGFSGFSGSGKTTLIEKLIPLLKKKGLKVAVIKHDGHDFEMDREGKDTYRFSKAGADTVMISSVSKSSRLCSRSMTLEEMLADAGNVDIILVEGYKYADIPRIGVTSERGRYELPEEPFVYRAIACDDISRFEDVDDTPVFDLDDAVGLSGFIIDNLIGEDKGREQAKSKAEGFTHFDPEGNARMVNVADKDITVREAVAGARVLVNRQTFDLIKAGGIKKGDVLTVAQIAGIMGAKRTPDLIPMCHPIMIDGADVRLKLNEKDTAIDIEAGVKCTGKTGVEMEALTACSVAALTVYDMCKSVQRDILIKDIRLLKKFGGKSGDVSLDSLWQSGYENTKPDSPRIAAAVLIGGHSTRMGCPKEDVLIPGDGRTFLEKICDEVDAVYGKYISARYLSVRKGQIRFRNGWISVSDKYDDIGPMGGLVSVLKKAKDDGMDAVLLLACDMIRYDKAEITNICRAYSGEDILWARTDMKDLQPLASIYGTGIIKTAREMADKGENKIRSIGQYITGAGYYDSVDPGKYDNVNSIALL